jgi:hypothetical protein
VPEARMNVKIPTAAAQVNRVLLKI